MTICTKSNSDPIVGEIFQSGCQIVDTGSLLLSERLYAGFAAEL